MISQIKDKLNGKIINTIKDNLGRIIYEAWKLITKSGIPPLSLLNCKGEDLVDYKLYGNSIQDGTPTPEAPIEVESVGNLITDTTDVNYGKYKIPVKTRKKNFFAIDGFATTSTLLVTKINNTSFTLTAKTSGTYRQSGTKYVIRVADLKNNFLTVKAENVIKTSVGTPLFVIRQYDKNMQLLAQLKNCQLKTSEVKVDLSNLNSETAWLGGILCLSNANETAGSYCTITDLQIYDGEDNSIITNIYLDEPLRMSEGVSDYIDFENQKVVRNTNELIVTGNETWRIPSANAGTKQFYRFQISSKQIASNRDFTKQVCNWLESASITTSNDIKGISIYSSSSLGGTWCRLRDLDAFPDLDTLKSVLQERYAEGNPLKIVYGSYEPSYEEIELPNIPTLKDVTVLQVNTKIQPSNMEVKYKGLD